MEHLRWLLLPIKIPHNIFETLINKSAIRTRTSSHDGFFWLERLEIFRTAFSLKKNTILKNEKEIVKEMKAI